MDTVYGTKKYFQSLSGNSDIYRSSGCRVVTNDYTYQNTLGRRSTLGAYYHMNKQPSYTNDHSINSQFGYNSWGIWRDGRNVAPSTFSAKTHQHYQKTKSFSIILTTAAFIILLAVISIAGLAFYFSTIKANMEDPVLGFEGSFRIAKGDLFSTGLKYNHTTTYKQKIEFYKRFVERALMDNGLHPLRTDVWGFGEGPLIKVHFRTFLDVRKLPQNIHSVEEYIKESLFVETTALKSLYRSLRIDAESVEIKRILDEQIVKSASLFKDAQSVPTSQTQLEKRLMKKGGSVPALLSKPTTTSVKPRTTPRSHPADDEPDVDVENAPVIQGSFEGSFEITKTDADIARKKVTPTKAYSSLPAKAVTPYTLRVKPKKPSIEKLTTIIPQQQTKPTTSSTTTSSTTTTTTTTTTTPAPTISTTTTTKPTTTTSTTTTTTTTTTPSTTSSTTVKPTTIPFTPSVPLSVAVPKLDSNLFTTVPILDTQPWRPIHREVPEFLPGPPPAFPTKLLGSAPAATPKPIIPLTAPSLATSSLSPLPQLPPQDVAQHRIDEMELPFIPDSPTAPVARVPYDSYESSFFVNPFRKPSSSSSEEVNNAADMMYYHSFGNPVYMPAAESIERLGMGAHVQPHPLPVTLIDDVVIPPFKPLNPTLGTIDKLPFSIEAGNEKFEHLGGGVIVKKHDNSSKTNISVQVQPESETTTPTATTVSTITSKPTALQMDVYEEQVSMSKPNPEQVQHKHKPSSNSELADTIGEFFMDLLNLPKEEGNNTSPLAISTEEPLQSRIEPEEEKPLEKEEENEGNAEEQLAEIEEQTTENSPEEEVTKITTTKPNFMNLREIILRRKLAANQTVRAETTRNTPAETTTSTEATTTTTKTTPIISTTSVTAPTTATSTTKLTTPTPTTTTTKRNRIRPTSNKPASTLDDSNLFPSHSKWEFVNSSSSSSNFGHTGNMRRVFNKTLQAWVSEDIAKAENMTLNDIKTRINNATNIQDISLIFDTLASKLGITPSVPNKVPPFSQNKMQQTHKNEVPPRYSTTSTTTTDSTTTTKLEPVSPDSTESWSTLYSLKSTTTETTTLPPPYVTTKRFIELPLQHRVPFVPPMSAFMDDSSSEGIGAAIPVVGEAEVEVIDPNKYEEMLKSSQFAEPTTTETPHRLVTLLPVRSNSGIRTYRPLSEETARSSDSGGGGINLGGTSIIGKSGLRTSITRKSSIGQSRRFPPAEAVVKGGIKVTVK